MSAVCLVSRPDVSVFHATHTELLEALPRREDGTVCDLLCVDAPYSDKTHSGHDRAVTDLGGSWNGGPSQRGGRRAIDYSAWTSDDVHAFIDAWAPVTRGWIVSLTDDVLFPVWREAMARHDRQTFQDVPALVRGMTVRLTGDGPSSWAIHCAVSRPRRLDMARWGTLRGGYEGPAEAQEVTGGKPLWLMEALVRDYSRPGDLICDPCCGGGRTLHAALRSGRRAIGGDAKREHADISARVVDRMVQRSLFDRVEAAPCAEQLGLLGETGS